ncbi:MAG: TetR/AcrR family transcriptional regulator [Acidobacteriota bacterium]
MPWEKQFDVDDALERAGEAFWERGYKATSMRDLLAAMGIQKGSFYGTYRSKRDAYLDALRRYDMRSAGELEQLVAGLEPLPALRAVFDMVTDDCLEGPRRGCMVVNCALELAHEDDEARAIVDRAIERTEALFARLIAAGQGAGDIAITLDTDATAKTMMALLIAMRVRSRAGGSAATIRTLADQAIGLVA